MTKRISKRRRGVASTSKRVATAATLGITLGVTALFTATDRADAQKAASATTSPEDQGSASVEATDGNANEVEQSEPSTTAPQETVITRRIHIVPDSRSIEREQTLGVQRFQPRPATKALPILTNQGTAGRASVRKSLRTSGLTSVRKSLRTSTGKPTGKPRTKSLSRVVTKSKVRTPSAPRPKQVKRPAIGKKPRVIRTKAS